MRKGTTLLGALLLLACFGTHVQAQDLFVVSSSPEHATAGVSADGPVQVSFTFNRAVDLAEADFLVYEPDAPADVDGPTFSGDGRTITYSVQHEPDTDYFWYVSGVYAHEGDTTYVPLYPLLYTTAAELGELTISGTVTDASGAGKAAPAWAGSLADIRGGHNRLFAPLQQRQGEQSALQAASPRAKAQPAGTLRERVLQLQQRALQARPAQMASKAGAAALAFTAIELYRIEESDDPFGFDDEALVNIDVLEGGTGSYELPYVRPGTYRIQAYAITEEVLENLSSSSASGLFFDALLEGGLLLGFYDADGNGLPDTFEVTENMPGVDLPMHPISYYARTAQDYQDEALAQATAYASTQLELEVTDFELVGVTSFFVLNDGTGFWGYTFYSAQTELALTVDLDVFSGVTVTEEFASGEALQPIPAGYADSDAVMEALRAEPEVAAFLAGVGDGFPFIFFEGGGWQFSQFGDLSPYPDRLVWKVHMLAPGFLGTLFAFVDMASGEVLSVVEFPYLGNQTARTYEAVASEAVRRLVPGEEAELVQIQGGDFFFGRLDPRNGTGSTWMFVYRSPSFPAITVTITLFGSDVSFSDFADVPEEAPAIPADYVDSGQAVALVEQEGGGTFLQRHPNAVVILQGGYNEELGDFNEEAADRPVWDITYIEFSTGEMPYLRGFVDMETGELLALDSSEEIEPSGPTARGYEVQAFAEAQNAFDSPRLVLVGADDVGADGTSATWWYIFLSQDGTQALRVVVSEEGVTSEAVDPAAYGLSADTPSLEAGYVNSSAALAVAEENGGSTFRETHENVTVTLLANPADYPYEADANQQVWVVIYRGEGEAELIVFVDLNTGAFLTSTGVDTEEGPELPAQVALDQNYPNPFNPSTVIPFTLRQPGHVTLKVFNLLGQEVVTLVDEVRPAGAQSVEWSANGLPSGVYIYRLEAGGEVKSRRMMLLK